MYINVYFKVVLDFKSVSDISFLFISEIWNDVQNGSVSTLISMTCQIFAVSSASSDLDRGLQVDPIVEDRVHL